MPVMYAENAEDPTARPAHCADFGYRLVQDAGIELVAAIALWPQRAEQAGLLEIGKCIVRQPPQLFRPRGALAQCRQQRAHAAEIRFRRHDRASVLPDRSPGVGRDPFFPCLGRGPMDPACYPSGPWKTWST